MKKIDAITKYTPIVEVEKTQLARLNTVLIFSPTTIFLAQKKDLSVANRLVCAWFAGTIAYTVGSAYLENKKRLDDLYASRMPKGLEEYRQKKSWAFHNSESTVGDVRSSQKVRLWMDGFFVLYFLYLAIRGKIEIWDKIILAIAAGTSIGYNAVNYFYIDWLEEKEAQELESKGKIIKIADYDFRGAKILKSKAI